MSIRTQNVNDFFSMVHPITGGFIFSCVYVFSCCWLLVILPIISPIAIPLAILVASGPMAPIFACIIFEIIEGLYPLILELSPLILELLSPLIAITVAIAAVAIGLQLLAITIHALSLVIACTLDISEEIIGRVRNSTFFSKPTLKKPIDGEVHSLSYLNTTQVLNNTSRHEINRNFLDTNFLDTLHNNEQNLPISRPIRFFGSFSQNAPNPAQEYLPESINIQQA